MCGITGFLDLADLITKYDLQKASNAIAHRGGNGNGIWFDKKDNYTVGLANERLATIDTSDKGLQPFTSTCGNYIITFNGTIYNYIELRQELIKYGVTFLTLTDTEVLLESYKKWGFKLFEKIDGAFAFAIIDKKLNQLFIARDAMGVKPLYYYKNASLFAFSSEIRGLLTYPGIRKTINKKALSSYLRHGYFTGDETIFEHIYSFKKQHSLTIDLNSGNNYEKLFSIETNPPKTEETDEENIVRNIEELLTDSILKRSISDVPVGVLLSGGYDSATVAAILQKNQTKRISTFTLGFEEKKFNEAPQASQIASYLKTNHHEYYFDKKEAITMLQLLPEIFDEPIADSGAIPLAYISSKINGEIKVVLGAEGGDELFGGYSSYQQAIKLHALALKIPNLIKPAIGYLFKSRTKKIEEVFNSNSLLTTYTTLTSFFSYAEISKLLNDNKGDKPVTENKNELKNLLAFDLDNYLPQDLLLKTDRICMHFGLDNRDALLKTDLVAYLQSLTSDWFIKDKQTKYLLKKITHKYIPENIMNRPKKGFSIPLVNWLKTYYKPFIEEYLTIDQLNKHQLFNVKEVLKIKKDFYQNGANTNAKKIWLLLQFQMWYNKWVD